MPSAKEVCSDEFVRRAAGPSPHGTIYQRLELEPGRSNSSSVIVSFADATSPSAVIAASIGQLAVAAFFLVVLFVSLKMTLTRHHREVIERTLDLERESASFRAIAQTTQMLAHDVRKPFSKLRAGLAMLERVQTPNAAREAAARLGRETTKSLNSVSGLLADVMEVGSPTAPLIEAVSVTEMIGEVVLDTLTIRNARHLTVRYELRHSRKATGERRKLLRVLSNLIDNAAQATTVGGTLWVATKSAMHEDGRSFVHITIGNTGSYIAPEDRQKLFTTFFTKGKRGGTGLGLAIAKKVVSDHGGKISCTSSKEEGTAFTFTIPEAAELDNAAHTLPTSLLEVEQEPLSAAASGAPASGHLVALIEDDVLMREYWKFALGDRLAYSCALPRQFWSDLEAGRMPIDDIGIIVTDYHFEPREWGISGESFAREVRKRLCDKRIVLCSDVLPS